ncbi:MAG TPA: carboxypeptidase-like regulatory domain-containing protein [Sporichthyaceae bacterium]|jgi:hypothetical protein|nr:carboxypeptidase-like regulatory domain-containing protein [Sporichthyaceae bacterium]
MSFKTGKAAAWVAAAAISVAPMAMLVPDAMASASPAAAHGAIASPAAAALGASVKNMTARVTTGKITLGWTNPSQKHLVGVVVRYQRGKVAPSGRHSGHAATLAKVKSGHVATSAAANNLASNANYAFSVWAEYRSNGKITYSHVLSGWTTTTKSSGSVGSGSASAPVTVTGGGSQSGSTGSVGGTVQDSSGNPLGGVVVTVENLATKVVSTVTSLSNGGFSLSNLPLGNYQVCFNALSATGGSGPLGYVESCVASLPVASSMLTSLPASLTSLVSASQITGLVTGGLLGTDPLSGVLVTATNTLSGAKFTSTTNSGGSYTLAGLPVGTYNIGFGGSSVLDTVTNLLGTITGLLSGVGVSSVASLITAPTQNLGVLGSLI